ncbi:MAG: hypothetical protein PHQ22_06155 [Sulfuricurvum sp.]|nr:hypothetical protein [Sulfuricurvum sp.]MDD5386759.1 hypothetical protein [Sulfuricurvum sp.]
MLKFGLACEGATDQAVIENILCGFYNDKNLRQEIKAFQPLFDETQQKQLEGEFGGWEILLKFISTKRFRQEVINNHYMIIQIDTDISEHKNFGVSQNNLSIEELIGNVKERLIAQIDSNKPFYELYQEKIIFAISVHSLECWILPLYKDIKSEKITGCLETLQRESKSIQVTKEYKNYYDLSRPLLKNKKLLQIATKNSSLQIFINCLPDLQTDSIDP